MFLEILEICWLYNGTKVAIFTVIDEQKAVETIELN